MSVSFAIVSVCAFAVVESSLGVLRVATKLVAPGLPRKDPFPCGLGMHKEEEGCYV